MLNPQLPQARLLLLGCSGFVGSHLVERLLAAPGPEIVGWDLSTDKIADHLDHPRLTFRRLDIAAPESRYRLALDIRDCDLVVNLAAICNPSQYNTEPLRTIYSNFVEPLTVVEEASNAGRPLIHFSTCEVYGQTLASWVQPGSYDRPELFVLDAERTPMLLGPIHAQRWTYAASKQLYERLVYAFHKERGLPYAIIRPFNFFGPRMDFLPGIEGEGRPRVLACFLASLLLGQPMTVVDGGTARRTITSIHDAIDAILLMLAAPERALNHIYNIGNPSNEVTILELAIRLRETFAEITGDAGYREHPIEFVTGRDFYGPGYADSDRRVLEIGVESERLGWEPKIGLDAILRETAEHYIERFGVRRRSAARALAPA